MRELAPASLLAIPNIAIAVLKDTSLIAAPIAGSPIMVAAMALFAVIVFRTSRG